MTKQTDTSAERWTVKGWNDDHVEFEDEEGKWVTWDDYRALAAERDEWKARAERAEEVLREATNQLRVIAGMDLMGASAAAWNAARQAETTLAQTNAEPSPTLADAYRAGLEAAADKAESMPTGIYPKDVAKAIRALIEKDKTDD